MSIGVESKRSAAPDQTEDSSFDRLFAIGSRIKYLIDSPETIYGCLDSKEFLSAAQRYVRATEVHKSFAAHSKHSAKRFPLLRHHWPLVKKLGTEAWDRAVEWLRSQGGTQPIQLAGVLAGMALLRPVDGADLLKHHLGARQAYIVSCLTAATSGDGNHDPATLAVVLADVAELVCTTIAQCGELFLSRPGVTSHPLLVELASKEDLGASELLFDPGSAKESAESAAWKKHQATACERLSSLASAGVALEGSQWLESLATQVAPLCEKLLEGCESGADLRQVEVGVQEALAAWRYHLGGTGSNTLNDPSSTLTPSVSDTHSPTKLHVEELSITDTCQWVVGHPVSLWPLLLEGPLVSRAKSLVAAQFDAVGRQAGDLIQAALSDSSSQIPCVPGIVDPGRWCDALQLTPLESGTTSGGTAGTAFIRRKVSGSIGGSVMARAESASVRGGAGGASLDPRWWIPKAQILITGVDANLDAALTTALAVTSTPGNSAPGNVTRQGSGVSSSGYSNLSAYSRNSGVNSSSNVGPSPRAVVLQPFVQETCSAAIETVATSLEAATACLPDVNDAENFGAAACAALFIGRVAQGMADHSAPLKLLLGPPAAWAAAREADKKASLQLLQRVSSLSLAAAATRTAETSPRLEAAQRRLRGIAAKAYSLWAAWASRGLAEQLVLQAASDGAFAADTTVGLRQERRWNEDPANPPRQHRRNKAACILKHASADDDERAAAFQIAFQ